VCVADCSALLGEPEHAALVDMIWACELRSPHLEIALQQRHQACLDRELQGLPGLDLGAFELEPPAVVRAPQVPAKLETPKVAES
jgi:hypothetical protein